MSFWGVFLEPKKSYSLRLDKRRVRISQATLGLPRVTWIDSRSIVRCAVGRQPPIAICSLSNIIHCCQLELEFEELKDVIFTVDGPYSVHLSGYYLSSGTNSTLEANLCKGNVGLINSKQALEGTNTFVDASNEKSGHTMLRIEQESCFSKNKRMKEISTLKEDEHKTMNPPTSIGCHKLITENNLCESNMELRDSKRALEGTNTFVDRSNKKTGRAILSIEQESSSSKNKRRTGISTLKEDAPKVMNHKSITGKSRSGQSTKVVVGSNDPNKEINKENGHRMPRNDVKHLNLLSCTERIAEEIDLNQLQQQSPGSSLSPDNNKVKVNDTSELMEIIADNRRHTAKMPVEDSSAVVVGLMAQNQRVRDEDVFHGRDVKRQKKLSYGLSKTSRKADMDQHLRNESICSFCHSSNITEGTGQMLYYKNGKEVVENVSSVSKVIPVHSKCIDWAPLVYCSGETIKNLEAELARAAKHKCSGCGRKGAALGCLEESCQKSYHLPCARKIQDCQWDSDNFLMLCPNHKSVKFPSEKSKSRKHVSKKVCPVSATLNIEDTIPSMSLACQTSDKKRFLATASDPKEWVLCTAGHLSSEEQCMLDEFAERCGATVIKSWNPNVTHVIAATDEKGACIRTFKYLMAILTGKWILKVDWIKACIVANGHVNEEPHEISLDIYGSVGGPKAGRIRASAYEPKLFDGFHFYVIGEYDKRYKRQLFDLVKEGRGIIIETEEQLDCAFAMLESSSTILVVYRSDTSDCMSGEESDTTLQSQAECLAKKMGGPAIPHTWILESIAVCKMLPFC